MCRVESRNTGTVPRYRYRSVEVEYPNGKNNQRKKIKKEVRIKKTSDKKKYDEMCKF